MLISYIIFLTFNFKNRDFLVADKQAQNVPALTPHQYISILDVELVSDSMNYFYKNL